MTDLERRVTEALERLRDKHAPAAPQPQQPRPVRRDTYTPPPVRREPARPAAPKVWGGSKAGRDLEGRFADAPDATHPGRTVRVFVFEVEPVNGEPYATCVRQDNRQRFTAPTASLTNVGDNA
jgi:hypothetical protein